MSPSHDDCSSTHPLYHETNLRTVWFCDLPRAFPTFHFYKKGARVSEMTGANREGIRAKIRTFARPGAVGDTVKVTQNLVAALSVSCCFPGRPSETDCTQFFPPQRGGGGGAHCRWLCVAGAETELWL